MKKVVLAVVLVVALLAAIVLVQADFPGCHCQYIGPCHFNEEGVGYRYYWCGNCDAYSGWARDFKCRLPVNVSNQILAK